MVRNKSEGESISYRLQFNSEHPEEYQSLRSYIIGEYNDLNPTTFHQWHETVNQIQDVMCLPYQVFLEKILKQIHNERLLPVKNICYCDNSFCRLNITSRIIYNEDRPLWDVTFSEKGFATVLNLARINDKVTKDIVSYYVNCVNSYFDSYYRINKCCPVSQQFIEDIELFLRCVKSVCYDSLYMFMDTDDSCIVKDFKWKQL